jgi:hypothetical protein
VAIRDYTSFKGVTDIGDSLFMSILEGNLKVFMDWGLLGIGAWTDVKAPAAGAYGGDFSVCRRVDDEAYSAGQVWETLRKDLVWESGVEYQEATGVQPIAISGVWVDGTLYTSSHVTYGHYIDYPNGRVVFDSAIPTTSEVKLNHSYRWCQVQIADRAPWFQELQFSSMRVDSTHATQTGSGDWSIGSQHRVQLPAVVIEAVPRRFSQGYELGNGNLRTFQDVLFHVVAETKWERDQLLDIISTQKDKAIYLFDTNKVAASSMYPLDYRGELVSNPRMYPDLVEDWAPNGYRWRKVWWRDSVLSEVESPSPALYEGIVRTTFEVIVGNDTTS